MIHNLMESPKNLDLSETSTFENCLAETSVAETSWSETSVAETSVHRLGYTFSGVYIYCFNNVVLQDLSFILFTMLFYKI